MKKQKTLRRLIVTAGITLIVMSIILTLWLIIPALQQEKINKWSMDIPLDMSKEDTNSKTFTPETEYFECYARFSMRGQVTDEFAAYRSRGGGSVPEEITRNFFSKNPFKVSWQLFDGSKEIYSGEFLSSDIHIWVYPDYVHYGYSHFIGAGNLKPGIKYTFVGKVEQPCEALNQLNPKISLKRAGSYKGIVLLDSTLFVCVPAFLLGLALLIINPIKNILKRTKQ